MEQFNWDAVFNTAKSRFIQDLSKHKIDASLVNEFAAPLMSSLYGLMPYLISDANKSEKVSNTTKQYINKNILPTLNKCIDDYWNNLGYVKKQTFKMLSRNNGDRIRGAISSSFLTFSYGLLWGLDAAKIESSNLNYVIDDLNEYMGYYDSYFVVAVVHKIQSLT